MKRLPVSSLVLLLCACLAPSATIEPSTSGSGTPPVAVVNEEFPSPDPSPTPACTALPTGMTVSVTPVSSRSALTEMTGLQPGEIPVLIFEISSSGMGGSRLEERPIEAAGAEGNYSHVTQELYPLDDSSDNHWQVQVIHQMGVACSEVTLPSP
jgi:hypothetical protein